MPKVDAIKLAQGKPAFADDIEMRGMLTAKVLHSPHAHAVIRQSMFLERVHCRALLLF